MVKSTAAMPLEVSIGTWSRPPICNLQCKGNEVAGFVICSWRVTRNRRDNHKHLPNLTFQKLLGKYAETHNFVSFTWSKLLCNGGGGVWGHFFFEGWFSPSQNSYKPWVVTLWRRPKSVQRLARSFIRSFYFYIFVHKQNVNISWYLLSMSVRPFLNIYLLKYLRVTEHNCSCLMNKINKTNKVCQN